MQKKLNIVIYSILILLTFLFIMKIIFVKKEQVKQFSYLNKNITVKITTNKNIDSIFNKIETLINKYEKLTDTKNEYEGINNLYYIRHNFLQNKELKLDKELVNMIDKGLEIYDKTNGKIDISKGNLYDLFYEYFTINTGYPSDIEISLADNQTIDNIEIKDKKINNNYMNINLDYIKTPYILNEIKKILDKNDIKYYYISCDNESIVGSKTNGKYKVATINPDNNELLKTINVKNKYISTINTSDYYKYNNKIYSKIVDTKEKKLVNNMKSITIITTNENYFLYLSKYLFMKNPSEVIKEVNKLDNVEVMIYTNDNKIMYSNDFTKNT